MIRYTLRCRDDHRFDSWFASAAAFDTLNRAGQLSCAECGSPKVEKAPMAPSVQASVQEREAPPRPLASPASPAEAALAALKARIEANSDYVGLSFAAEARAMHDGDKPHRAIHGEARPAEARRLIEDGIPVAPLPFRPTRKSN